MLDRIVQVADGYDHEQLESDLQQLQAQYPLVHTEPIGVSVTGRKIWSVRIGDGPRRVHYNAACHANEWITTPLLMTFLEDYAQSINENALLNERSGPELRQLTTLFAVPMANPDGVELVQHGAASFPSMGEQLLAWNGGCDAFSQWKSNIRGVDLNDQYPAGWEVERQRRAAGSDEAGAAGLLLPLAPASTPGPRDYGGHAPLTEPESVALAAYTWLHRFDLVMSLHSQGREIYWNYRDYEPPEALELAERLAAQSGYRAVKLSDSDAGYKDWFIQEFRRPGFTVEIGYGVNPLPIEQFQALYQEVLPILEMGLFALDSK